MTAPRPPSPLDRAFFALVTRGWNADKIASYESTLRKRDKELSAEASHTFVSIDTKATGLLTHTSMMIAGLGLIAPLVHAHEFEAADHVQDDIHRELIIRTELYSLCIRAAILFTMVVFALLPLLYFWTSEKAA